MRIDLGRLVFPALRWDAARRFAHLEGDIDRAITLGVGGFVIVGGGADDVAALLAALRGASPHPLLIGAAGAPDDTLQALLLAPGDPTTIAAAARTAAREARAMGIDWILSPVGDATSLPEGVADYVDAMQREGVLAAVSYTAGPAVLESAVDAGVATVVVPHACFREFESGGAAAPVLDTLLREPLGFEGLVAADLLAPNGSWSDGQAAVHALGAGCDVVVGCRDAFAVQRAIETAVARPLARTRLDASLDRRDRWARWVAGARH